MRRKKKLSKQKGIQQRFDLVMPYLMSSNFIVKFNLVTRVNTQWISLNIIFTNIMIWRSKFSLLIFLNCSSMFIISLHPFGGGWKKKKGKTVPRFLDVFAKWKIFSKPNYLGKSFPIKFWVFHYAIFPQGPLIKEHISSKPKTINVTIP